MAIFDKAKEKFRDSCRAASRRTAIGAATAARAAIAGAQSNTPQPQQEVPAGAFGGGVMPDTMFGGNAGFESVAATGGRTQRGGSSADGEHRSFQDLLNRALGKQDKQSGAQRRSPCSRRSDGQCAVRAGSASRTTAECAGGGNAMNSQNPYNNPQYGMGRASRRAEHAEHERAVQQSAVRHEPALPECTVRSAGAADGRKPALQYGV